MKSTEDNRFIGDIFSDTCSTSKKAFDPSIMAPARFRNEEIAMIHTDEHEISTRVQRSMSAPPVAEHVGSIPPPMYAESEFNGSELDARMHPDYYHYYAPRPHNPRLPVSYNTWENMCRAYKAAQSGEKMNMKETDATVPPDVAPPASQAAFEAAVAAAGGQSLTNDLPSVPSDNHDSSDSNRNGSKSLMDRIQEDFPRTPSPVYGAFGTRGPISMNPTTYGRERRASSYSSSSSMDLASHMQGMQLSEDSDRRGSQHLQIDPRYMSYMDPRAMAYYQNIGIPSQYGAMDPRFSRLHQAPNYSQDPRYRGYALPDMRDGHLVDRHSDCFPPRMDPRLPPRGEFYNGDPRMIPRGPFYPRDYMYYASGSSYYRNGEPRDRDSDYDISMDRDRRERYREREFRNRERDYRQRDRDRVYERERYGETPTCAGPSSTHSVPQVRSTMLEDFRGSGKSKKWELSDLRGHVVEFSQDQHGSRFIQQKLEISSDADKQMIFEEILPEAYSLMTDVFGNYVIQKFFDHGSTNHRRMLADCLFNRVLELALQMYGCRVIQKALEVIEADQQILLISELKGHVMKCVKDQNGNHVVQKCIEMVSWNTKESSSSEHKLRAVDIQFVLDSFTDNVYMLATHPYGCRVIQRVLEHCSEEQTTPILDEIQRSCYALVQDQYGNYVVQHVLEHGKSKDRESLIDKLRPQIVKLSQHKFASNVVEKCLAYATLSQRKGIISDIIVEDDAQPSALQVMMKDPYANYVIQKIIDVADAQERDAMVNRIKANANQLKRFTYGKHILSRLEKLTGQRL